MEKWGIWKYIKVGFWLGVGFIIPQLFVLYSGTYLTMLAAPSFMGAIEDEYTSSFSDSFDVTENVKINDHEEKVNGNQLLIIGSISNIGDSKVSSIQLEAELLDDNGKFVYECSEYIRRDLKPGDTENYQINCGCGKNPLPEYASVTVRVVSASKY